MNTKLITQPAEIIVAFDDLEEIDEIVNEIDAMFKELMSSDFDDLIEEAVSSRGCVFVDQDQPKVN